jgi:DNA-binding cell septation regulator SpoVG
MSLTCPDYNCDELADHERVQCEQYLQGGNDAMLVLSCGHGITDPSNETQVNAAIAAGTAKLVSGLTIGIPAGSPVKIPNPIAGLADVVVTYNRTITVKDFNVTDGNIDFWNGLTSRRSVNGLIVHNNQTDKVQFINSAVTFEGSSINPEAVTEFQRFELIGNWINEDAPSMYDAPTGVFS